MHVQVGHALAHHVVQGHKGAVGAEPRLYRRCHEPDPLEEGADVAGQHVHQRDDVRPGHDEHVALEHRRSVEEADTHLVVEDDRPISSPSANLAEHTGRHDAAVWPTMNEQPRLPLLTEADDPALAELFAKGLMRADGQVLNIFGALANHPDLLRRWLVFAAHVLSKSTLNPRDRELLILRTGWNCRSRYEWGQHVLIALDCGITNDEIDAVKIGASHPSWIATDAVLLTAADELHVESALSDETWAALAARYSPQQLLDIVATVGNYHVVAMFLNSLRVPLDPGVPEVDFNS